MSFPKQDFKFPALLTFALICFASWPALWDGPVKQSDKYISANKVDSLVALTRLPSRAQGTALLPTLLPASFARSHQKRLRAAMANLPLSFEPTQGQIDPRVQFMSRGRGYSLFLTATEAVLRLSYPAPGETARRSTPAHEHPDFDAALQLRSTVIRMKWEGAATPARVTALDPLPGKSNYFVGNDPHRWRTNVPSYSRVRYQNLYPGIDLVCYGSQGQLEYDFVLAPGADPGRIHMLFEGTLATRIAPTGDLVLQTEGGEVRQKRPHIYQEIRGTRHTVTGRYVLRGEHTVGFEVKSYDATQALVIDPVLVYSSFLGGSELESANAVAVDSGGNIYITGETISTDFPTQDPLQPETTGTPDAFVTKMDASGTALIFSTYLGGNLADRGNGIALDPEENIYLTGRTGSLNFPVVNALFPIFRGGAFDAFVSKLSAEGNALLYSTYLGGGAGSTPNDAGFGIAVDSGGNAYVTGGSMAEDFPVTPGAFQPMSNGSVDAFVTKLDPAQTGFASLVYSTYLGGFLIDRGNAITVDAAGNAYVTGRTASPDFPTRDPLQGSHAGGLYDAFITLLNDSGTDALFSTYLGGSSLDEGNGIAVDSDGSAFVTGETGSTDFPTSNAFQEANGGGSDAFLANLDSTGTVLLYSTYFGGSLSDRGAGIALDAAGNVYVTGETSSTDFPTREPFQAENGGRKDAFVAQFDAAQQGTASLLYSSYLGGSGDDTGLSIAVDSAGNAWTTGQTASTDFPTANAFQASYGGGAADTFVAMIADDGGFQNFVVFPPRM